MLLNVVKVGGQLFAVVPQQQLATDFQNYQSYDMDGNEYTGAYIVVMPDLREAPADSLHDHQPLKGEGGR